MTRTAMTVGFLSVFLLGIGTVGLSVTPASAAEMMQTDKAMHKATGEEIMNLKQELATLQAELQKLSDRVEGMRGMTERAANNYCKSIPQSLRKAGFAPGLCE